MEIVNRSPRRSLQQQAEQNDFRINKGRHKARYYSCGVVGLIILAANIYYLYSKNSYGKNTKMEMERTTETMEEFNTTGNFFLYYLQAYFDVYGFSFKDQ